MPNFNAENSPTQQPWHAYYCHNTNCQLDEEKNQFFLNNFMNPIQQDWVGAILGQGDNGYEGRLTEYRKIAQFFLEHLPNMAFKLVGGAGFQLIYQPLLLMGRVRMANGTMDHRRCLRLHYTEETGFVLVYSQENNNPPFYGLNLEDHANPLAGHNFDPGHFLGIVSINNDIITISNIQNDIVEHFLEPFNGDPNNAHIAGFTNSWNVHHPDLPYNLNLLNFYILPPPIPTMINLNTILYGPPGTGKTYKVTESAVNIIDGSNEGEAFNNYNVRFSELQRQGRIEFTTFHQNYAYEDFIEGLRAEYDVAHQAVAYRIEAGILKRIAYRALHAWLTGTAPGFELSKDQIDLVKNYLQNGIVPTGLNEGQNIHNYVLIIDEINRGNVARIFGELITLVEDSKRARRPGESDHGHQPLLATLPYTKEPFILPPNLYIIGTMNTADRSLIGLDAALRRRFFFEEMPPIPQELQNQVIDGVNLETFLTQLNERILTKDVRDHCIGHAYFMEVKSLDDLASVMRNKVIPQLQEYFHDSPKDLHQLLQFGNDSFVDQNGQTKEACLTNPSSYQNFCAP